MPFLKIWVIHKKLPCFPRCSNLLDNLSQDCQSFHHFVIFLPDMFSIFSRRFFPIFQPFSTFFSHFPGFPQVFPKIFTIFPERTSHFRCRPRWFLEEAAGFLAKELRDWSQARAIPGGMGRWGNFYGDMTIENPIGNPWKHDGYYMELIWNILGDMENWYELFFLIMEIGRLEWWQHFLSYPLGGFHSIIAESQPHFFSLYLGCWQHSWLNSGKDGDDGHNLIGGADDGKDTTR